MTTTNEAEARAPRHPIGVVVERTGLSHDVLRVWERRYGVVEPGRGPTGQRLYSDTDIERLRLLHRATLGGRGIGRVAAMPDAELSALVRDDEEARARVPSAPAAAPAAAPPGEDFVAVALERALALDGTELEAVLRRAVAAVGLPAFMDGVAGPFLRRIGDGWHAGRVTAAQEHLASAAVRRVLVGATASLPPPAGAPGLVVATPAGERHELGALLAAAAAAVEGWRVTYLGADLPADDVADAAARTGARVVGVSVVYAESPERVLAELRRLRARLPAGMPLLAGGAAASAWASELERMGIRVMADLASLAVALREMGREV